MRVRPVYAYGIGNWYAAYRPVFPGRLKYGPPVSTCIVVSAIWPLPTANLSIIRSRVSITLRPFANWFIIIVASKWPTSADICAISRAACRAGGLSSGLSSRGTFTSLFYEIIRPGHRAINRSSSFIS